MDLLRFLARLPLHLLRFLWVILLLGLRGIRWLLKPIVGDIDWRPPSWMPMLGRVALRAFGWIKAHPLQVSTATIFLLLLSGGGWYGYRWYQNRPRPIEPPLITFNVKAPEKTNYEQTPIWIYPLQVNFSGSVAPINLIEKDVTEGIQVNPPIEGRWVWSSDKELGFWPKTDWPIGQKYQVTFDKKLAFAEHVRVKESEFEFSTAPFKAALQQNEFYQDPQNADIKKAIFHVQFSHPVDTVDFEKRVNVSTDAVFPTKSELKFTVNYDDLKLNAYIHSEPLTITPDSKQVYLKINDGVHAVMGGGDGITNKLETGVNIPYLYSLAISKVQTILVDNEKFEPEQVMMLDVSQDVIDADLAKEITACILPTYHPKTPQTERTEPYSWGDTAEIGEDILQKSQKLPLTLVPNELPHSSSIGFKYRAEPGQYIFIKVNKGLKSFGGFLMRDHYVNMIRVPAYPELLKFMAKGSLLSLDSDRRVSVTARDVPGMEMEIARVLPDQLQHLVTLTEGSYENPLFDSYRISPDHITERFVEKLPFNNSEHGKVHYEGIDLGKYLGPSDHGKRGVFLLKLSVYDPAKTENNPSEDSGSSEADTEGGEEYAESNDEGNSGSLKDSRLIVVTDLGILVKKSLDESRDVFVQSIHSGEAVADATVDIVGKNGQTLFSEKTDAGGRVHFGALKGLVREKLPTMIVVKKGEDLSFLPLTSKEYDRRLDYSRFDIGGINNAKDTGQLSAYLFSDRGMYRPGDTFHIGMIVRAVDWNKTLTGIPLQAAIVDPRGVTVDRQKIRLSAAGFEEVSFTPAESAPTGEWNINLYIVKNEQNSTMIGSTTVRVKEFLPDRMKISAQLTHDSAEGWVKPDDLYVNISLQNLFGTPAQQRRVTGTMKLNPTFPSFHSYPDYQFFDGRRAKEGYSESLGDQTTDDEGKAEFMLPVQNYADATYQLQFLAEGFEAEGGRSVAAAVSTLVSSNDYLIGVKTDGDLNYVNRGAERHISVIAIDPEAKKTALNDLKATLIERKYVSVLIKQNSGVYKYESRSKDVVVSEKPLAIPATGLDYSLVTANPGNFSLVISNAQGQELNRIGYSVAGNANLTRSLERNAELQLALSKKDYAPGSDIEVSIRAPYVGSGLITLERDRVYSHAWFKATTTSSVQKIHIPADFEGNGYVNVQFIRDPSSDEIFMSPLSYGVIPFSVNRDARREAVTVSAPSLIKPGENLTMKVKSTQPARVAVFAVDEGILQVARYKLGDPLDFFFQKRMLEVETSQILDLILPEFNKLVGMAAPGGDEDSLLSRHLNPFKRKRNKPVAYWSGIIDVNGEKELSYPIPEYFNGRIKMMAVAVAPDKVGIVENSTTVRGDFVLSPNIPAMVAPGDEFEVSVGVANNLSGTDGKELPINVQVKLPSNLEAIGKATQEISLAEKKESVVIFKLRTKDQPGAASLTFTATAKNSSAKMTEEISVRPATPYRTEIKMGNLEQGTIEIKPLREMYDDYAKRETTASYVPLVLARGLSVYLENFPHYCTEQLMSRVMPLLVFAKHPEFGQIVKNQQKVKPEEAIAAVMRTLHSRQNNEGGFGLWTSTPQAHRYASVYAMQFLLEAKERGWIVPSEMLELGNKYLQQTAADESVSELHELRERAFAAYLLTRQGVVTTNYLAAIQKRLQDRFVDTWRKDITAAYLASSMKLLKQDKEAAKLLAEPEEVLIRKAEMAEYHFEHYYDPLIADATTLYLLSRHFPERLKNLSPQALQNIAKPLGKGWYNTLSSAMTVLALESYASQASALGADKLTFKEVYKDATEAVVKKSEGIFMQSEFTAKAQSLKIDNQAPLAAWYSVTQSGFDRGAPTSEIKEGMEIIREYTDTSDNSITTVGLGDEIDVHLKIRSTRSDGIGNVAIVDLLPGGFEPVLNSAPPPEVGNGEGEEQNNQAPVWQSPVGLRSSTWALEYADVREDRIVIYGYANPSVSEFVYRIKATNVGTFTVSPTYGESMYDRTVQARSLGSKITVEKR